MTTTDRFEEDELHDYIRGDAAGELHARIEAALAVQPALRAEIALMRGLKDAFASEDVQPLSKEFGWQKLKTDIARESKPVAARPARWQAVAACLGLLAVGQAAYITMTVSTPTEDLFETATSGDVTEGVLVIAFTSDVSAGDIIALLDAVKGEIIGGPNTIGMFRVAFDSAEDARAAQAVFEASDLIDLVANE